MSFATGLLLATVIGCGGLLMWHKWPKYSFVTKRLDKTYDYVIVGGGTAGSVLAARLSADSSIKVALIEAGGEESQYSMAEIPHESLNLQRTSADWAFQTVPQNNSCYGLKDKRSNWPRGKVLGGSSVLSMMSYVRGNRHDFDEWAHAGAVNWSYEDVLPYFKKSENNKNIKFAKCDFHGTKGPLSVQDSRGTPRITTAFQFAGRELGYRIRDINGESQMGVSVNQMTAYWGRRVSAATAYLEPVMRRRNLHVATHTLVTKVLFQGHRAVGVQYEREGVTYEVRVKKEVILAAGTIGTAQLLLLSGVGPTDHLNEMGIKIQHSLPVGEGLVDPIMTDGMIYTIDDAVSSINNYKARGLLTLTDFLVFGAGQLSSTGVEGVGFFNSRKQPESDKRPHLQIMLWPMPLASDDAQQQTSINTFNYVKKYFTSVHGGMSDKQGLLLMPVLLHPRSTGSVRLESTDPHAKPLIHPNYLEHIQDLDILVDGIRLSQAIMETKAFKAIGPKYHRRFHPGCDKHKLDSDEYWQCYIRHNTLTAYNPTGTCRMGAAEHNNTVVTPDLRVKGISHLRVIDASILPSSMSGGTAAAAIMIAEKGADIILNIDSTKPSAAEEARKKHLHEHHSEL